MNATTLIREKPVKPHSRSGNPQERIPPLDPRLQRGTPLKASASPPQLHGCPRRSSRAPRRLHARVPEHCERDHEND